MPAGKRIATSRTRCRISGRNDVGTADRKVMDVPDSMSAVVMHEVGGPEVLRLETVPVPRPSFGQVLVRVGAAGVDRQNIVARDGTQRRGKSFPLILGHEIAGDVAALGPGVRAFAVGDRVACKPVASCGLCHYCRIGEETVCDSWSANNGGYAQYVCIPDESLIRIPDTMSYEDGAILGCAIGVGYHALKLANASSADTVLVTGAGGGIGSHTVQLARAFGARVIAQTSSPKADFVGGLGADEVIISDDLDFGDAVRDLTGGRGASVVIENIGHLGFEASWRGLAKLGRFVFVGATARATVPLNPAAVFNKAASLFGPASARSQDIVAVLDLVERGLVQPLVTASYPLHEAAKVHQLLEDNRIFGKAVLVPPTADAGTRNG